MQYRQPRRYGLINSTHLANLLELIYTQYVIAVNIIEVKGIGQSLFT